LSTPTSRSRSSRTSRAALPVLALALLAAPALALGAESGLEFLPAADHLFPKGPAPAGAEAPPEGQVLVLGRLTGAGFAVDAPEQVELLDPDGRQVPLRVEEARLWRDPVMSNRIVSMDFRFLASAADVAGRAGGFRLRWGPGVKGPVTLAGPPALDPARREACREFRLAAPAGRPAPTESQSATITVVADSRADWYFLWYLLPMVLIVALLVARRVLARAGVGGGPGAGGAPDARDPR